MRIIAISVSVLYNAAIALAFYWRVREVMRRGTQAALRLREPRDPRDPRPRNLDLIPFYIARVMEPIATKGCKQSLLTEGCKQSLLTEGCKQSLLNPVFEQAALERERVRALTLMRHRLIVESLNDDLRPRPHPEYEKVASLCKSMGVVVEARPLMRGIYEDREMVERFPAFHILLDGEWEMTVYTAADVEEGLYSISGQGSPQGSPQGNPQGRRAAEPGFWSSLFARVLGWPQMPPIRRRVRVLGSEGL